MKNLEMLEIEIQYNNSSTTTSLQEIVEATVASHFISNEVAEGIV
jgi:hypothetical protein